MIMSLELGIKPNGIEVVFWRGKLCNYMNSYPPSKLGLRCIRKNSRISRIEKQGEC